MKKWDYGGIQENVSCYDAARLRAQQDCKLATKDRVDELT